MAAMNSRRWASVGLLTGAFLPIGYRKSVSMRGILLAITTAAKRGVRNAQFGRLAVVVTLRSFKHRRKFAQALHGFDDPIRYVFNFVFRVEAAEPEANRTVRQIFRNAKSAEHVAGFQRRGGTG